MTKNFTSMALLFAAMTLAAPSYAAAPDGAVVVGQPTETIVGEDNYAPTGQGFDWGFDIDFNTQKLTATVDLSTCSADNTNENVLSVGTDINAYFSNVQMAGNIHLYYTPSTKTLSCQYISSNENYGAWKYIIAKQDIEGEITVDLSRQYGFRLNGEQVFNPSQLTKLLTYSSLHFGSLEGSTRSNATYKQARVVSAGFESVAFFDCYEAAKLRYQGKYTRFDSANMKHHPTSFTTYEFSMPQLSIGGKVLGDVLVYGVPYECSEGSGNNNYGYIDFALGHGKATVTNLGEMGKQLGLTEGQEIDVDTISGYFYGPALYASVVLNAGGEQIVYSHGVSDAKETTFTNTLKTTFSGTDGSYDGKTLLVKDYGDGFADLTFNNLQFATMGDSDLGNLVMKEVPYTFNGAGEQIFTAEAADGVLENSPSELMKNFSGITLDGKVSGEDAYFTVEATAAEMPVSLVFGEPIAEFTVYTGKQTVYHSTTTDDFDDATVSVRPAGEGKYTMVITNVDFEKSLTFEAEGTEGENGLVTYTAEQAEAPISASGWEGYYAYIDIVEAKSQGDKFYGVFSVDFGGFASSYPDYGHTVVFGEDFDTNAINAVKGETEGKPVQIFTIGGTRVNAIQKGVNIVRTADGNTIKVVKK